MGKLTALQAKTLRDVSNGLVSIDPKTGAGISTVDRRSLNSLRDRGLVKWFPKAPTYRITYAGRTALETAGATTTY